MWLVTRQDESHLVLRVWLASWKKAPLFSVVFLSEDKWLNFPKINHKNQISEITSGKVAEAICYIHSRFTLPLKITKTLKFEYIDKNCYKLCD